MMLHVQMLGKNDFYQRCSKMLKKIQFEKRKKIYLKKNEEIFIYTESE